MFGIKTVFSKPDLLTVKAKELSEAQFSRLEAQTAVEYAESLVTYNDRRIARLKKEIAEDIAEQEKQQ